MTVAIFLALAGQAQSALLTRNGPGGGYAQSV